MASRWRAWLGAYVVSQAGLYLTVKVSLSALGPALTLPVYLLGGSAMLLAAARTWPILGKEVALLGLMQASSAALWLSGLYLLPPAPAAAINYFMPFVAMGLSALLLRERVDRWEASGAGLAALGVAVVAAYGAREARSALGVALTAANTVAWASYSLYYRRLRGLDPVLLNASSLLVAGLVTLPALALAPRTEFHAAGWTLTFLAGALASSALTYVSWTRLMNSASVARATLSSYAAPAAVAALQAALGRPVAPQEAAGLGLMVLGAFVAFGGGRSRRSQ